MAVASDLRFEVAAIRVTKFVPETHISYERRREFIEES